MSAFNGKHSNHTDKWLNKNLMPIISWLARVAIVAMIVYFVSMLV